MLNINSFLYTYLNENSSFSEKDIMSLTEENKKNGISNITTTIVSDLSDKQGDIDDTYIIDRSRGDIRQLQILSPLQQTITKLEELLQDADSKYAMVDKYVKEIIKTIMYLNEYRDVFKSAYNAKKTVLMLKYKEVVLALCQAQAYLIAQAIDFTRVHEGLYFKDFVNIEEVAPLKAIINFNKQVANGNFKLAVKDVSIVREEHCELPLEQLQMLMEAADLATVITDGFKDIVNTINSKGRLTNLLTKAVGIVLIIISMRDVIYTMYRSRTKFSDIIDNIKNFANLNISSVSDKLKSFQDRFVPDIESASGIANNEIKDQDRTLAHEIAALPAAPVPQQDQISNQPTAQPQQSFQFDF